MPAGNEPKRQAGWQSTGTMVQQAFSDLQDAGVDKEHNVAPAAMKAIIAALEEKGYLNPR